MQENTHWTESTQTLTSLASRQPVPSFFKAIQTVKAFKRHRLPTLQTLVIRGQCAVEWLAVNLVSTLPHPFSVSLRKLAYPLLFAHRSHGLYAQASLSSASQPFGSATIASRFDRNANRRLTQNKVKDAQTNAPRSLYENCLRGCLKREDV